MRPFFLSVKLAAIGFSSPSPRACRACLNGRNAMQRRQKGHRHVSATAWGGWMMVHHRHHYGGAQAGIRLDLGDDKSFVVSFYATTLILNWEIYKH